MLFQNELSPVIIPTEATTPVVALVKSNDVEIGKLTGFPIDGKLTYYLESILLSIAIKEPSPDFVTKYLITKPNPTITIEAGETVITEVLTCGSKHPTDFRLTNNARRASIDSPYQVTYFVTEAVFAKLYGSVNDGEFVELAMMKVLSLNEGGAFLTVNYHKFYEELGASEYDTVNFKFDKLSFVENIKLDAIYTDFPFNLVMRNQYGFWDCFRLTGSQEQPLEFVGNTMENTDGQRTTYNETTEKISVNTGYLEQNERQYIANNLMNLDFYEYRNDTLFRIISDNKNILRSSTKEVQDQLKLDFKYAKIIRRY